MLTQMTGDGLGSRLRFVPMFFFSLARQCMGWRIIFKLQARVAFSFPEKASRKMRLRSADLGGVQHCLRSHLQVRYGVVTDIAG